MSKITFGICLLLISGGYWMLDSAWSYLSFEKNLSSMIFREPMSYMDTILLNVPPYQVVSRIMVVVIFNVAGILMAMLLFKSKKAENIVREQRDFLNTLVETIPNPVYYKKRDGTYSGCNNAFEHFIGKHRHEITGNTAYDILEKDTADNAREMDRKLFNAPGVQHYESKLRNGDGQYRNVIFDRAPLLNKKGEVVGLIGVITDITERKKTEKEKMILERQLRQSQKMESIGTLAGGIAHDFNNILYGMIGYIELCLDDAEAGTQMRENLKRLLSGGKRAKSLVDQILTFSRPTAKAKRPIQLDSIVREVSHLLRSTIPTTIDIEVATQVEASTIIGDPTQIQQVIMNLSTNAHHAMEEKGGTLGISLSNVRDALTAGNTQSVPSSPHPCLKLSVSDTGTGIPREIQDRIFDPFFTTKEQGKGTGMGLSVVHGIVQSHNGHVEVTSSEANGTRFDIFLPLIKDNDQTRQSSDSVHCISS